MHRQIRAIQSERAFFVRVPVVETTPPQRLSRQQNRAASWSFTQIQEPLGSRNIARWQRRRWLFGRGPCPLWVKSRHVQRAKACPLYPRKRHQTRHMEYPLRAKSGHRHIHTGRLYGFMANAQKPLFASSTNRAFANPALTSVFVRPSLDWPE